MYILKQETNFPLKGIARVVGRRNHTTVIHGVAWVERRKKVDREFRKNLELLQSMSHQYLQQSRS